MSDILLFKITTEECEPFEGKSLEMLIGLLKNCDYMETRKNIDGEIEIACYKRGE